MLLRKLPFLICPSLYFLTGLVFLTTFISCTKETDEGVAERAAKQLAENRTFQPLTIGTVWVYQIDSVYYVFENNKLVTDSVSGIYRETIVDTFHNAVGNPVYRIVREKEDKTLQQWIKVGVYGIEDQKTRLIRQEGNVPFIELTFPLRRFSQWKATSLIDGYEPFYIKSRELPIYKDWGNSFIADSTDQTVLGNATSVLTIKDVDNDDGVILSQYSERKYAKNVGLIYKEQAFYTTQRIELSDLPWREKADVGFEMKQTLIQFNWK